MESTGITKIVSSKENTEGLRASASAGALLLVSTETQGLLSRMFADPNLLEKTERQDLVAQLRQCVAANPEVSELRVLLGMALCVNFEVSDAIEELREGVRLSPNSFIANLKMGELWMRLRVIEKAEEHTKKAGLLAANPAQSELARRQGASLRALRHAGIARPSWGSAQGVGARVLEGMAKVSRLWRRHSRDAEGIAVVDAG